MAVSIKNFYIYALNHYERNGINEQETGQRKGSSGPVPS